MGLAKSLSDGVMKFYIKISNIFPKNVSNINKIFKTKF